MNTPYVTTTNPASVYTDVSGLIGMDGGSGVFFQFTAGNGNPWGDPAFLAVAFHLHIYAWIDDDLDGTATLGIFSDSGNTVGSVLAGLSGPVPIFRSGDPASGESTSLTIPISGALQSTNPFVSGQKYWIGLTNFKNVFDLPSGSTLNVYTGSDSGTPMPVYTGPFTPTNLSYNDGSPNIGALGLWDISVDTIPSTPEPGTWVAGILAVLGTAGFMARERFRQSGTGTISFS